MKKNLFFVGMLAMALVFGLIFTACPMDSNDDDGGGNDDLSGAIVISSTLNGSAVTMDRPVGQPLYAVYAGSETVTYQWKKGGVNLSGATGPSYTPNEAGAYTVTVSRAGYNSKTSASVTVSGVAGSLHISDTSGGTTAIDRAVVNETLYAVYGGTGTPTYLWKQDGSNITGATGSSYTPTTTGEYAVTMSVPGFASITSASVAVTNNPDDPVLSGSLHISLVLDGAAATEATTDDTLWAVYAGTETVTYQWKQDGVNLSGATTESLITNTTGAYTVMVSADNFPSKTSASVTVSYPVLTGSIVISTTSGGSAVTTATTKDTLYAAYTGEEPGTREYQWKQDGTNVSTSASYTPTVTGSYTVTVTVSGKSRISDPVVVSLPVLSGNIVISLASGGSAVTTTTIDQTLYAVYSGGEPGSPEYQWKKDGNVVSAGSSSSYKPTATGSYTVTVMVPGYQSKTSGSVNITPSNPFVGTWTGNGVAIGRTLTITASTWEVERVAKGSYTRSGATATLTPTHDWEYGAWQVIPPEYVSSYTATVSGNTISCFFEGEAWTFVKSSGNGGKDDPIREDPSNPFVGTWTGSDSTITFTASAWVEEGLVRGSYTYSGSTAIIIITHYWEYGAWQGTEYGFSYTATVSGDTMSCVVSEGGETWMLAKISGNGGDDPDPERRYTVTFDLGGGGGTAPADRFVPEGTNTTLPGQGNMTAPAGKYFQGWRHGNDWTTLTAGYSYPINYDVTFTAVWGDPHTVTFDLGGVGGTAPEKMFVRPGETIALPDITAPEGEVFQGWRSSSNSSVYQAGASVTITANTTFTALWATKTKHKVTFSLNGLSGTVPADMLVASGETITLPSAPTAEDKLFRWWSASTSLKTPGSDDWQSSFPAGGSVIIDRPVTFTANWIYLCLVRFDLGEASGTPPASMYVVPGTVITLPAAPIAPEGKVFQGWRNNNSGNIYQAGDSAGTNNTSILFTAQWAYKKYGQPGIYISLISFAGNARIIDSYGENFVFLNSSGQSRLSSMLNSFYAKASESGTALFYGVHKGLANLKDNEKEFSTEISSVNLITFTDGLDNGSFGASISDPIEGKEEVTSPAYAAYVHDEIGSRTINGTPITAYSVGVKGADVGDEAQFAANLGNIASKTDNVKQLADFSQLNATFTEIADTLIFSSHFSMTTTQNDPGTIVRMTFDVTGTSPADAAASSKYLEGTLAYSGGAWTLANVTYGGGITSDAASGATIPGTVTGSNVSFLFRNIKGYDTKTATVQQWTKSAGSSAWQRNSEYSVSGSTTISPVLIQLALDASTSLNDSQILQIRTAVNNFINTLYNRVTGN